MIFQDPMTSLNPVLTIGRQIREALEVHFGMDRKQADTRATELLDQVGIPSAKQRLKDYPHQFSGGMRQRAMIAMALACEPKLLIADEPTTALDVTIQAQILELLQGARRRARHGADHDHARPRRRRRHVRARERDVRRHVRGDRHRRPALRAAPAPVHARPAAERAAARRGPAPEAAADPRVAAQHAQRAERSARSRRAAASRSSSRASRCRRSSAIEPGHYVRCFNPVPADEWQRTQAAAARRELERHDRSSRSRTSRSGSRSAAGSSWTATSAT